MDDLDKIKENLKKVYKLRRDIDSLIFRMEETIKKAEGDR